MTKEADKMSPASGKVYGRDGESVINWAEFTEDLTLLASAERTENINSADQTNSFGRGVHVTLNVTVREGTSSITLKIQGKDPVSGEYYDILEGAAVDSVSTNVYKVHPSIEAVTNVAAKDMLPRVWRVRVEHGNADAITYSVGASVVR